MDGNRWRTESFLTQQRRVGGGLSPFRIRNMKNKHHPRERLLPRPAKGTGPTVEALSMAREQARNLMRADPAMVEKPSERRTGRHAAIAMAVAIFGVLSMLVVDHGPWSRAHVDTAVLADHLSTAEAANAAGATVTPTPPTLSLEPEALGPKPVQPAAQPTR